MRSAYSDFQSRCRWGTLSADGVLTGFDRYLAANDEDVRWATTVAAAFEQAGGSGAVSTLANSAVEAALRAAGVDATRDDIVIDPPTAFGNPPTTGYADDPVNTSTGNFLENETDLAFAGATRELVLTRTYNSFDTAVGAFGVGWSAITEARLELTDDAARMVHPDGRVVVFPRLGEAWDRAAGASSWLARTDTGLRVSGNDGAWWDYSASGELLAFATGPGVRGPARPRGGPAGPAGARAGPQHRAGLGRRARRRGPGLRRPRGRLRLRRRRAADRCHRRRSAPGPTAGTTPA